MEYFAGLYLAKYAPPEAATKVNQFSNDPDWYWVWRFAIETPAKLAIEKRRLATLANLFRKPASGRRPNELIYRAWDVMESAKQPCEEFVRFQREFKDLLIRKDPVAEQIENSFRPCPPDPARDSLTYLMGAPESDDEAYGNETPQISQTVVPFLMSDAPITKAQFWLYDPEHQHDPEFAENLQEFSSRDNCPVLNVTWYDSLCYARWCGSRLPTEIEWEYACRAGTTTRYWWGDKMNKKKCTFDAKHTTAASKTHANPWGLVEMSGNVSEWCDTWYGSELATVNDPNFVSEFRALRGGSFNDDHPQWLRSANRGAYAPGSRSDGIGFRVSRTRIGF